MNDNTCNLNYLVTVKLVFTKMILATWLQALRLHYYSYEQLRCDNLFCSILVVRIFLYSQKKAEI